MTYRDVQVIRARYPKKLSQNQQEEILSQIPAIYDSNLELGFNIESPMLPTEIELYYKYIARTLGEHAKECETTYKQENNSDVIARVCGHLLYAHVKNAVESDTKAERNYHELLFLAWKNATSPELFQLQLEGYRRCLNIHFNVFGKDSKWGKALEKLLSL